MVVFFLFMVFIIKLNILVIYIPQNGKKRDVKRNVNISKLDG